MNFSHNVKGARDESNDAWKLSSRLNSRDDDWKVEYHELSEDYRFFVQVGWQSTVAVLGVDGLLVGAVIQAHSQSALLGFVPLLGAVLTFIMASQQDAWDNRWLERIRLLHRYDMAHGFSRFHAVPRGYSLRGTAFLLLQIYVGLALVLYSYSFFFHLPFTHRPNGF